MSDSNTKTRTVEGQEATSNDELNVQDVTTKAFVRDMLVAYKTPVSLLMGGAVAALFLTGRIPIPELIPSWLPRHVFQGVVVGLAVWKPLEFLISLVDSDTRPMLKVLDPVTGDGGYVRIPHERWNNLTVVDKQGDEIKKSQLHQTTTISGRTAYEVDEYNEEENVAVVSWMGGFSNQDIRRFRSAVDYIQEELSAKADRYETLVSNLGMIKREAASKEINRFIHTFEGVLDMDDHSLTDSLEEAEAKYGLEVSQQIEDDIIEEMLEDVEDPRKKHGDLDATGEDVAFSHDDAADSGGEDR